MSLTVSDHANCPTVHANCPSVVYTIIIVKKWNFLWQKKKSSSESQNFVVKIQFKGNLSYIFFAQKTGTLTILLVQIALQ